MIQSDPLAFHRRLSIAPMLDWTDRHYRFLARQLSRDTLLYSEMVVATALVHTKDPDRFLRHRGEEHPVALQLGGSDMAELAQAARMGQEAGYAEINLNCGCPSDRVQAGRFGACLMSEARLVSDCIKAMQDAVSIPVTVKTRIGVDHSDSWGFFRDFVGTVADAGCGIFTIHARKAWLKGLSPRENRDKPPLDYGFVYRLKREMPHLSISLNGGVRQLATVEALLNGQPIGPDNGEPTGDWSGDFAPIALDGVMVGRAAYEEPWMLVDADARIFHAADRPGAEGVALPTRKQLLEGYIPYVEWACSTGTPVHIIAIHLMGIFAGLKGARKWRQYLSDHIHKNGAGPEVLLEAAKCVEE